MTPDFTLITDSELLTISENVTARMLNPETTAQELEKLLPLVQAVRELIAKRESAGTLCSVKISHHGPQKISVIREIRTILKEFGVPNGLAEAKALSEGSGWQKNHPSFNSSGSNREVPPGFIVQDVPYDLANKLYLALQALGAQVELVQPVRMETMHTIYNYDA